MKHLVIISVLFLIFCPGRGQDPEDMVRPGLFSTDSLLIMTLRTDLHSLMGNPQEDPSYQDAELIYEETNDTVRMNIRIRARGSFRRKPENCNFPPIKIKFSKTERKGSIFENLDDVKLVTHCQTDQHDFEQYVLQEYLIYKAYNEITDYSFQVRLARIHYVDTGGVSDTITRFAFLIESAEHMAERMDCRLLEPETFDEEKLDRSHFALMAMFNYMILNTDYSISIIHNVELLIRDHFSPPIPVPYDFDWSGIINIPYDSPYAAGKARYAGRLYKGPCIKRKELDLTLSAIQMKRDPLFKLYREFPYLDEDMRSRSLQHLSMFFIIITSRELIRQEFIKNCKD